MLILDDRKITMLAPFKRVIDTYTFECRICLHQWTTALNNILNAATGCPKCAGLCVLTNESIDHRLKTHNMRVIRIGDVANATTKITWQCMEHHTWKATPDSVLNLKSGCRLCKRGHGKGLQFRHILANNPDAILMPTLVYILQFKHRISQDTFIKVGVTTLTIEKRFKAAEYRNYDINILRTYRCGLREAVERETQLCDRLKQYQHKVQAFKFGGRTECFEDVPSVRAVLNV